jgi:hypothetical protein
LHAFVLPHTRRKQLGIQQRNCFSWNSQARLLFLSEWFTCYHGHDRWSMKRGGTQGYWPYLVSIIGSGMAHTELRRRSTANSNPVGAGSMPDSTRARVHSLPALNLTLQQTRSVFHVTMVTQTV